MRDVSELRTGLCRSGQVSSLRTMPRLTRRQTSTPCKQPSPALHQPSHSPPFSLRSVSYHPQSSVLTHDSRYASSNRPPNRMTFPADTAPTHTRGDAARAPPPTRCTKSNAVYSTAWPACLPPCLFELRIEHVRPCCPQTAASGLACHRRDRVHHGLHLLPQDTFEVGAERGGRQLTLAESFSPLTRSILVLNFPLFLSCASTMITGALCSCSPCCASSPAFSSRSHALSMLMRDTTILGSQRTLQYASICCWSTTQRAAVISHTDSVASDPI